MSVPIRFVATVACVAGAVGVPPIGKFDSVRSAPFHPSIHNLGNVGCLGRVHAWSARLATWVIDQVAYDGVNMRHVLAQHIAVRYVEGTRLLEVGCGVGTLTRELEHTQRFDIVAMDTSKEMLDQAKARVSCTLLHGNGIDFDEAADVSVICMVMHEMPPAAHGEMLDALLKVTNRDVWVVDIDPTYEPPQTMLSGEPYMPRYLETIQHTIETRAKGRSLESFSPVEGHVRAWVIGPIVGPQ